MHADKVKKNHEHKYKTNLCYDTLLFINQNILVNGCDVLSCLFGTWCNLQTFVTSLVTKLPHVFNSVEAKQERLIQ